MEITDELIDSLPGGDLYVGMQLVLVYLKFPIGKFDDEKAQDAIYELGDLIGQIVDAEEIGHYDGHEFCYSPEEESVTFFIYGPDAENIQELISPLFANIPVLPGSYILKRYGDIGSPEEQIFLN